MKSICFILVVWSLAFVSCSRGIDRGESAISTSTTLQDMASERKVPDEMVPLLKASSNEKNLPVEEGIPIAGQPQQIIRTANLVHEVTSTKEYNNDVRNLLKKYNAYIFKEDNSAAGNRAQTTMVIKVPVGLFDSLIVELVTKDVKPLQKNITSEDITSEIIDTRARLETRKATRDKYLEFLNKAGKIEDVLKIQQEINNIQEDIESAEARLSQLSGQASYSTINLTYFEPNNGYENYNNDPGFWNRVGKAIRNGGKILGEIFIAFVTAWPFWVLGLVLGLAIRKYRKRNKSLARKDH